MIYQREIFDVLKKIWQAFLRWRKKGMWFRVTVLLVIGSVPLSERLISSHHVPLINELVWIAIRAVRYSSEPRVSGAYLRYFHAKESRILQGILKDKFRHTKAKLTSDELKLLNQNTLHSNFNKLFFLAQKTGVIPKNDKLANYKQAMLALSLELTRKRFDSEWNDAESMALQEEPFSFSMVKRKASNLLLGILMVIPYPLKPVIPWMLLCMSIGALAAWFTVKAIRYSLMCFPSIISVIWVETSLWNCRSYYMAGFLVFFLIWGLIGAIWGMRMYRYFQLKNKEKYLFAYLFSAAGIMFLFPGFFFKGHGIYWWLSCPGDFLMTFSSRNAGYFYATGFILLVSGSLMFYNCYKCIRENKI